MPFLTPQLLSWLVGHQSATEREIDGRFPEAVGRSKHEGHTGALPTLYGKAEHRSHVHGTGKNQISVKF